MALSIEELNQQKQAPAAGLMPALAHRWSPRAFTPDPISPEDLKTLLEAARWAASSSNIQPWRFFVGVKGSETHSKIMSALVPFNQAWAGHASVLILGVAVAKGPKGHTNDYALYDLGQAVAQLTAQAVALGLATHSMAGFDHQVARNAFGLTDDYAVGAVTAIGHQAGPDALENDQLKEREAAPRERKPLSEIALIELDKPFEF